MEQRQLNFAEKPVQVLTLGELERSYHENLPTGDPVGGIYHFALIQRFSLLPTGIRNVRA